MYDRTRVAARRRYTETHRPRRHARLAPATQAHAAPYVAPLPVRANHPCRQSVKTLQKSLIAISDVVVRLCGDVERYRAWLGGNCARAQGDSPGGDPDGDPDLTRRTACVERARRRTTAPIPHRVDRVEPRPADELGRSS